MADDKSNAAEYWKANVRLIFGCLVVWAFVSYGCAILFRPLLAGIPVGGTDLASGLLSKAPFLPSSC